VVEQVLEGLVTDVATDPDPLLAHSCAQCVALRTGDGEASHNAFEKQLHAVANQAGSKQWDSHQLQQNGKGVIQNVNKDGKHGLQQLTDS
jgi:hypothetical protein